MNRVRLSRSDRAPLALLAIPTFCLVAATLLCAKPAVCQVFVPVPNPVSLGTGASTISYGITHADYDSDGDEDVFVVQKGLLRIVDNVGGVLQAGATFGTLGDAFDVVAGDWDGDGAPDLAVSSKAQNLQGFQAYRNNGNRTFSPLGSGFVAPLYHLAAGDLNGDGWMDLVAAYGYNGHILVGMNAGAAAPGTFQWTSQVTAGTAGVVGIALADFDQNGTLDAAVSHNFNPVTGTSCEILANDGTGVFTSATSFVFNDRTGYEVTTGDFDGDGDPDLAVAHAGGGVRLCTNPTVGGGGWTSRWIHTFGSGYAVGIVTMDFDGDGRFDLVHSNASTTATDAGTWLMRNNPNGTWTVTRYSTGRVWSSEVVDIDGDGRAEIVSAESQRATAPNRRLHTLSNQTLAAASAPFGTGCHGSAGTPHLRVPSAPWLGTSAVAHIDSLPAAAPGLMVLGFGQSPPLVLPPPYAAPGLILYVAPTAISFCMANPQGQVSVSYALPPSTPALQGTVLTAQYLAIDPAANVPGLATSNPVRLFLW